MKLYSNDENLKNAYKKIEDMIISSNEHRDFIEYLIKETSYIITEINVMMKKIRMLLLKILFLLQICLRK